MERRARVVGDGPVIAAQPAHVVGDLLERLGAIAPVGVVVQRALEIGPLDEARDFARLAGVELTLVLAQLRRDVGEVERGEDVLLGFAVEPQLGVAGFLGAFEQAVLVEAQAAGDGALAHGDVVLFAAGEVGLRERILGVADDAQVALDSALENDAGLGVALGRDGQDAGLAGEKPDDRLGSFRRNEEVDVADDFLVAAQTPGGAAAYDIGVGAELLEDRFGEIDGGADVVVRGVVAAELDALEDF